MLQRKWMKSTKKPIKSIQQIRDAYKEKSISEKVKDMKLRKFKKTKNGD